MDGGLITVSCSSSAAPKLRAKPEQLFSTCWFEVLFQVRDKQFHIWLTNRQMGTCRTHASTYTDLQKHKMDERDTQGMVLLQFWPCGTPRRVSDEDEDKSSSSLSSSWKVNKVTVYLSQTHLYTHTYARIISGIDYIAVSLVFNMQARVHSRLFSIRWLIRTICVSPLVSISENRGNKLCMHMCLCLKANKSVTPIATNTCETKQTKIDLSAFVLCQSLITLI